MILSLKQFEEFPVEISLEAEPAQFNAVHADIRQVRSLKVDLTIQKSKEEYFCQGRVSAEVVLECARCLSEYSIELAEDVDFIIRSEGTDQEGIIDDEDYAYFINNDMDVDLTDIVKQAVHLALPMKPLCRGDCLGLCSQCGTNLNEASCNCKKEKIDPRWEGLNKLREQKREGIN